MPDAGRERNDQLEEFERRLVALERQLASIEDVTTEKTSKKEKIAAICAFAQNKTNTQASTVAVTAAEIRGCVGVSRRYA